MSHVRDRRVARSDSVTITTPFSVHDTRWKRNWVLATSVGSPVNGALSTTTLSRFGTCLFGSPWSSASAHTSVEGSTVIQR